MLGILHAEDWGMGPVEVELLSSELSIGHCVILNDVEQPCSRLVAVITNIQGGNAYCKYLCADPKLSSFNKNHGMLIAIGGGIHNLTPISKFGVTIIYNTLGKFYFCLKTGESSATYKDGKPRQWQETVLRYGTAKPNIANIALKAKGRG
jgi:hypothetical protein